MRLLLKYATPQKRHSLTQSQPFNTLKHLLMQRMRHQGMPIPVNSLSVTLTLKDCRFPHGKIQGVRGWYAKKK